MGWIATVKTTLTIAKEVYKFLRELDEQGAARLGPGPALNDRRRLQRLAVWLHDGEDRGLRRLFKADNVVDEYIRDVLQSDLLKIYLDKHTSVLDQQTARKQIMDGAGSSGTE